MSRKVESRVLVIQDASCALSTHAVKWIVQRLSLKPGDRIKIIKVIQPFSDSKTSSSSLLTCLIPTFRPKRLQSSVTIKNKENKIEEIIADKLDKEQNSEQTREIVMLPQMQQIGLEVAVEATQSVKEFAVRAAKEFEATYVILDRNMKKDKKYIKENLTCTVLRMRNVENLQDPNEADTSPVVAERGHNKDADIESSINTLTTIKPVHGLNIGEHQEQEGTFMNRACSVCKNRRPRTGFYREYEYCELQFATDGFSERNVLPEGGREIYRGRLLDGQMIAVRKICLFYRKDFESRIQMLANARHENVATLLGSCSRNRTKLLVYEYVCNGSLNMHLSTQSKFLTWERRMKIARGVAKGLAYLHKKNIFGNVRPINILINHDYEPLLGNFGLSRSQYDELDHSSETRVLKTFEYLAPEYEETGVNSSRTDIYSFGVVLLELITGRKTIRETHGQSFLRWAKPLLEEKRYGELADPTLSEQADTHQLFWMVRVAEKCLCDDPRSRHSIEQVVDELTCINEGRTIKDFSPTESELLQKNRRQSLFSDKKGEWRSVADFKHID